MTKTATVSLHGNLYQVDAALAGAKVELVFDPFDLSDIDVRHHNRPAGKAVPFRIGRHVHPKARADTAPPQAPTGIDYLRLVEDRHTRALGQRLRYAQLSDPTDPTDPTDSTDLAGAAPACRPPADDDRLAYDTDLLALAGATAQTHDTPEVTPDARLQAELDRFAARLPHHSTGSTRPNTAAPTNPEETR